MPRALKAATALASTVPGRLRTRGGLVIEHAEGTLLLQEVGVEQQEHPAARQEQRPARYSWQTPEQQLKHGHETVLALKGLGHLGMDIHDLPQRGAVVIDVRKAAALALQREQ